MAFMLKYHSATVVHITLGISNFHKFLVDRFFMHFIQSLLSDSSSTFISSCVLGFLAIFTLVSWT